MSENIQGVDLQGLDIENLKNPDLIDKITGLSELNATEEEFQNFMQRVTEVGEFEKTPQLAICL